MQTNETHGIAARFAHELAGPIGATGHALELMEQQLAAILDDKAQALWRAGVEAELTGHTPTTTHKKLNERLQRKLSQAIAKNKTVVALTKGMSPKQLEQAIKVFDLGFSYKCARMGIASANGVIANLREWGNDNSDQKRDNVSVAETLRMAWYLVKHRTPKTNIIWRIEGTLPAMTANLHALTQVWMNILLNAAQVNKQGCTVEVAAYQSRKGKKTQIVVKLTNDGAPLPRGINIFAKGASARKGGSGLGLHICRQIIKDHGGDIVARNAKSKGVEFYVVLPIQVG